MSELGEHRIKRLRMRSMRRGIREMDLILSKFANSSLTRLTEAELDLYETLLSENDHDLYQWVTAQQPPPDLFHRLIEQIQKTFSKLD